MLRLRLLVFLAVIAAFATTACLRKDYPATGPAVEDVELLDADAVDADAVLEGLATAKSPRFLYIWDGVVFDYEVYDEALLERDLDRVERYYRARGYYEAKVTAARVLRVDEHHVRVQIRVHEGLPLQLRNWTAQGLEVADFDAATAALRAVTLKTGNRFDEATYEESKKALLEALANQGYPFAKLTGHVTADLARHEADVSITVTPGKRSVFGPVKLAGLQNIPERPVRANLRLREGRPYSAAELDDARAALVNLGVFSSVNIEQDLSKPESGIVPVTMVVQEAPLHTLRVGGGARFDVLELSNHLTFGWEHRNFLGGMRKLKLEAKPGLVYFPTRLSLGSNKSSDPALGGEETNGFVLPQKFFLKNKVRAELRQPSFIEGRTTAFVASEFNIYPVLYPNQPLDLVFGYQEYREEVGFERAFFRHHLYVTLSYEWQANYPFLYAEPANYVNQLQSVRVSYPDLNIVLDFRDDPLDPRRGFFFSNDLQLGNSLLGGNAVDVRVLPEVRTYVPISRSVTFALRATMGFLFPSNYGQSLQDSSGNVTQGSLEDQQKLLFRAFYSGGPNSNRGYPFRGVGPHGVLGLLLPSTAACEGITDPPPECLRPLGGLTLWEASAEVRFPIVGALRGVVFVDASDVSRARATIGFRRPHVSPGLGLRYATPIGPVRLDVGYRVPYLQEIGSSKATGEGPEEQILGAPIAIQVALGEAF